MGWFAPELETPHLVDSGPVAVSPDAAYVYAGDEAQPCVWVRRGQDGERLRQVCLESSDYVGRLEAIEVADDGSVVTLTTVGRSLLLVRWSAGMEAPLEASEDGWRGELDPDRLVVELPDREVRYEKGPYTQSLMWRVGDEFQQAELPRLEKSITQRDRPPPYEGPWPYVGELVHIPERGPIVVREGGWSSIGANRRSRDGSLVAIELKAADKVDLLVPGEPKPLWRLELSEVARLGLSRSGDRLAVATDTGGVELWDTRAGRALWQDPPSLGACRAVAWSGQGWLAVGAQRGVVVLDRRGEELARFETSASVLDLAWSGEVLGIAARTEGLGRQPVRLTAWSPCGDGRRCQPAAPGAESGWPEGLGPPPPSGQVWAEIEEMPPLFEPAGVRVERQGSRASLRTAGVDQPLELPFPFDVGPIGVAAGGGRVAVAGFSQIWVVEGADHALVDELTSGGLSGAVALSPDGEILAAGSLSGGVLVRDTAADLQGAIWSHSARVTDLAFGPGRALASCSADGTVSVISTRDRRFHQPPPAP